MAAEIGPDLDAIHAQRSLLAETDQVRPLVATLAGALRDALSGMHLKLTGKIKTAGATLVSDASWSALDARDQQEIRRRTGLEAPAAPAMATDDDLRRTLDARPLDAWRAEIDAVTARIDRAMEEAAKRLQEIKPDLRTTTVKVRRGTLADEMAVRNWLQEQEEKLVEAVKNGPVIVR